MKLKSVFALLFLTLLTSPLAHAGKKILMMVPNDFMWPEYQIPKTLYEQAGYDVVIAGRFKGKVYPDRRNKTDYPHSGPVEVNLTFNDVKVDQYDAITFVAGNGAWHDFFPSEVVHSIVRESFQKNQVIGLLCASTGLLGLVDNWDGKSLKPLAMGKPVVGYFRVEGILRNLGKVRYIPGGIQQPGVAISGNLVTGRNPESSLIFGKAVLKVLSQKR